MCSICRRSLTLAYPSVSLLPDFVALCHSSAPLGPLNAQWSLLKESPCKQPGFGLRVHAGVEADVDAFGMEEWEEIARLGSSGRSGHECSMQWAHQLLPSLNLGPWSAEEDAKLVKLQAQHGMHSVSTPVFT